MIGRTTAVVFSAFAAFGAVAGVSIPGTGAPGGLSATNAASLSVQRGGGGSGHLSIVPYFSTQRGNSTLINVVNTDTDTVNAKAVKVRFRSAGNGDSVFGFSLFLAPADTWSINVSSDGVGGKSFATVTDTSCTLPANINAAFSTARLPVSLDEAKKADWTREGLVEFITMADIPPRGPAELYTTVASSFMPERRCGNPQGEPAAFAALRQDPTSEAAAVAMGLDTPTTGVRVTSILINIQQAAISWTTPVTSLTWLDRAGAPARGRLVFSPQTADAAPNADLFTNDPLLRSVAGGGAGRITPIQADLPDLSTPYAGTAPNAVNGPFQHTEALGQALQVNGLRNLFLRTADIAAVTDWTVTQPLRRYAAAADSSSATPTLVFNRAPAGPSTYYFPQENNSNATSLRDGVACNRWQLLTWDPSGIANIFGGLDQLGIHARADLCGSAGVVLFDDKGASILKSSVNAFKPDPSELRPAIGSVDGWAVLRPSTANPLPLLGTSYAGARGPVVADKATSFGIADNHDVLP